MIKVYRTVLLKQKPDAARPAPAVARTPVRRGRRWVRAVRGMALAVASAARADDGTCTLEEAEGKRIQCLIRHAPGGTIRGDGRVAGPVARVAAGDTLRVALGERLVNNGELQATPYHKSVLFLSGEGANLENAGEITRLQGGEGLSASSFVHVGEGAHALVNRGLLLDRSGSGALIRPIHPGARLFVRNEGRLQGEQNDSLFYARVSGALIDVTNTATGVIEARKGVPFWVRQGESTAVRVRNAGRILARDGHQAAFRLGRGDDVLTLEASSEIVGTIDAGEGRDALVLAGDAPGTFDLGALGEGGAYRGFESLRKTEAGVWTLAGAYGGAHRQDWWLEQGQLILTGQLVGAVRKAGTAPVAFDVKEGGIEAPGGVAIAMERDGDAYVRLDGTQASVSIRGQVKAGGAGSKTLHLTGARGGVLEADAVEGFSRRVKDGSGTWRLAVARRAGDADQGYKAVGWELRGGVLQLGSNAALGGGPLQAHRGTLRYEPGVTIGNRILVVGPLTLEVAPAAEARQLGGLSGAGAVSKRGAGRLTFNGDSQGFSGAVRVQEGELTVNGALGSHQVDVVAGAMLSGNAAIAGSVDLATAGHLAPGGHGAVGRMTIGGDLLLSETSRLAFDLAAPGAARATPGVSDTVEVGGDLRLDGVLDLRDAGGSGVGYYRLMTYRGQLIDRGLNVGTSPASLGAHGVRIDLTRPGAVDLVVGALPDPGRAPGSAPMESPLLYWNGMKTSGAGARGGGDGVWSETGRNWTDAGGRTAVASAADKVAIFDVRGGVVTVEGARSLDGGMQVLVDGYRFRPGRAGALSTTRPDSEIRVLDGATTVVSVPVAGEGGLHKTGGGSLVLSGMHAYAGPTRVSAGTLQLDGEVPASSVTVGPGGALRGSGRIGQLDARGLIDPAGDAVGVLQVEGDLHLRAQATYRVSTVTPEGAADAVQVGGQATIEGARVEVRARSGAYRPHTDYRVLSAGGGIVGQFGDVSVNLPFLKANLRYAERDVYLSLERNDRPYTDLPGLDSNQKGVGAALTRMASVPRAAPASASAQAQALREARVPRPLAATGPMLGALQALTAADARRAFKQLSGESYASLQNASRGSLAGFMNAVGGRFGRPAPRAEAAAAARPLAHDRSLWVLVPAERFRRRGDGDAAGYDGTGVGVVAGVDRPVSATVSAGVAAGFMQTRQKAPDLVSKAVLDQGMLALYGRFERGRWWLGGLVGAGYGRLSNTREIRFAGFRAKASGSAPVGSGFARAGGGYRFGLGVWGEIAPVASLEAMVTRTGRVDESGGGEANLRVAPTTRATVASEVGAHWSRVAYGRSGRPLIFEGSLRWRRWLNGPNVTQNAALAASDAPAHGYRGAAPARDGAVFGVDMQVGLARQADLTLGYLGQYAAGESGNGVWLRYRKRW